MNLEKNEKQKIGKHFEHQLRLLKKDVQFIREKENEKKELLKYKCEEVLQKQLEIQQLRALLQQQEREHHEVLIENKRIQSKFSQKDNNLKNQQEQLQEVERRVGEFSILMEKLIRENQLLRSREERKRGGEEELFGKTGKTFKQIK